MTDPCLTCHLPLLPDGDCQESSSACPLHFAERLQDALHRVEKDTASRVLAAYRVVRIELRATA